MVDCYGVDAGADAVGAGATLGLNAWDRGFGALVGIGGNAADALDFGKLKLGAVLDVAAGKLELAEAVIPLFAREFLFDDIFSGVWASSASREMISLPWASFSGVVPNLAVCLHQCIVVRDSLIHTLQRKRIVTYQVQLLQHQQNQ